LGEAIFKKLDRIEAKIDSTESRLALKIDRDELKK